MRGSQRNSDHSNKEKVRKGKFIDTLMELGTLLNARKHQDIVDSALRRINEDKLEKDKDKAMIRDLRKKLQEAMEENRKLKERIQQITGNGMDKGSSSEQQNNSRGTSVTPSTPSGTNNFSNFPTLPFPSSNSQQELNECSSCQQNITPRTDSSSTLTPSFLSTNSQQGPFIPSTPRIFDAALQMPTIPPTFNTPQFAQFPSPSFGFQGFNGSFMTPPQSRNTTPALSLNSTPGPSLGTPGNYFSPPSTTYDGFSSPQMPFSPMFLPTGHQNRPQIRQNGPNTLSTILTPPMEQQTAGHSQSVERNIQLPFSPQLNIAQIETNDSNVAVPVVANVLRRRDSLGVENRKNTETSEPNKEGNQVYDQSDDFFRNFANGLKNSSSNDQNATNLSDVPLELNESTDPLYSYLQDDLFSN